MKPLPLLLLLPLAPEGAATTWTNEPLGHLEKQQEEEREKEEEKAEAASGEAEAEGKDEGRTRRRPLKISRGKGDFLPGREEEERLFFGRPTHKAEKNHCQCIPQPLPCGEPRY